MKSISSMTSTKTSFLFFCLIITGSLSAQDYWSKIPSLTTQCYGEKDDFTTKVQAVKAEVKAQVEKSKKAAEDYGRNMTQEQQVALAMKYQNMQPDEIVKMQTEMAEITQASAEFQQKASAFELRYNELEEAFRSEFGKRLGPIEAEAAKLPDGEGTPQWAIDKAEELVSKYNTEYEAICNKYFSADDAVFRIWLNDFQQFLLEQEIPFNDKMIRMQYSQIGFTPSGSEATLMAVDRYLEKISSISGLRRPYPQG